MISQVRQNAFKRLSAIAASWVLLAPGLAQSQQLTNEAALRKSASFHAHRDFFAPAPNPATQADMNGDGILDLLVPSAGFNNISLLLGNADGTFQPPVSINAGAAPLAVVAADFNRDGIQDIAATTVSGISIILGEGNGNFGTPLLIPAGSIPQEIIAADFNGDRKLDLAVANFGSNDVSVFLGKGDGTFSPNGTFAVGMGPLGMAMADFNGDGRADLVVSNSGMFSGSNRGPNGKTLAVLLGKGNGTFQPAVFISMKHTPEGVAVGDFNKDGKQDVVVVLNSTDQVASLLGNGDGTFQAARFFTIFPQSTPEPGTGFGPTKVALADFDGDGNQDLAVVDDLTSTIGILVADGKGNFNALRSIEVSRTPVGILTGDYNHDGKADFISSNFDSSTLSVVLGNGDGTFVEASHFLSGAQPRKMVTADFNEDGIPDLALVGGFGVGPGNSISILLGKRGGGFAPKMMINVNANIADLASVDINKDGHIDLLGANFGALGSDPGGITVLLGKGDGTFQPATNIPAGSNPLSIAVADFNGDGKLDAVVSNRVISTQDFDSFVLLPGDGKGGFGTPTNIITFPAFATAGLVLAGDFNGDGKMDIAYVETNFKSMFSVQFGNGDGTFGPPKILAVVPVGNAIFTVSMGDFNNDGNSDFAIEEGGLVEMVLGDGKGHFVSKGKFFDNGFSSFSFIPALVLADFNGDGLLDIAATDGFADDVTLLFGNGDGTLSAPALIVGGGHTAAAVSADFDGDGQPDIALATTVPTASPTSPGEVILLLNTTPK